MPARRRLRILLILGAFGAVLVGAAVALAQGVVPIKISAVVKVTPNKAGTPSHPQGVVVDVRGTVDIPFDYDPPITKTVDVWISRGGVYNGAKFPTCSQSGMEHRGLSACPRGSIMGHGTARALADTVPSYPRITVVNGGARKMYLFVVLTNPARVAKPIPVDIARLRSGKWAYKLHAVVPRSLQIVAGIPLRLQSFHVVSGRGDWIATTSCPAGNRWSYHVEATYESGQVVKYDGRVPCRR
ncbi:MAG TPA: hypothetical protein VK501_24070 [Baekduia sp.]|uniref:hypothetical protein n=1 Tax=Baekduia sp. TaxID=2600305 RepID=UPI002BCFEE5E|nr:hypothetical protein [Baekduia sp.]HMJ37005.1 hypothetical protein [Baekduia sp.]